MTAAISDVGSQIRRLGFRMDSDNVLMASTYVYHIWTVSHESAMAVRNLEIIEERFKQGWGLTIKDGSREFLVPRFSVLDPAPLVQYQR